MSSFLDKIKLNTAIDERTKMDLSSVHISSADFMQFNVAYSKEMVPRESIDINMEVFTRMEPLVVPTFGRADIHNRAFFVPFRTVFPFWNEFITDTPVVTSEGVSAKINQVPVFDPMVFWSWLIKGDSDSSGAVDTSYWTKYYNTSPSSRPRTLDEWVTSPDYGEGSYDYLLKPINSDYEGDFRINIGGEGSIQFEVYRTIGSLPVKLTPVGRQIMKIMNSLGYSFSELLASSISEAGPANYYYMSALPLLCLCKVYMDWFYPSQYDATVLDSLFNYRSSVPKKLSVTDFGNIFRRITRVSYDADYFTAAFDRAGGPTGSVSSTITMSDPTKANPASGTISWSGSNQNVTDAYISTTPGYVTNWTLMAVKKVADYVKRHQLVGSRVLDRYLSRFGIQLQDAKLNRSMYLGSNMSPLQIGDVMSQSDTETASLGSYAGKGVGFGSGHFDFDADEYGMIIIVSSIVPKIGYYQGVNRNNLHINRFDFYTPEFDSLGNQAISKAELYQPGGYTAAMSTSFNANYDDEPFGYIPRYAEYKVGRDILSGDKRIHSMSVGQDSWHLMRTFDFNNSADIVHSLDFIHGTWDSQSFKDISQYNRIFQNQTESADHFNVIYSFQVTDSAPMASLFDNYEFDDKGSKVTVDANGVKMN